MSDLIENKLNALTRVVGPENSKHFRYLRACGNVLLFRHTLLKRCLTIDSRGQVYRFVGTSYEMINSEIKDSYLKQFFREATGMLSKVKKLPQLVRKRKTEEFYL